mgnify:CR=1 FL=1
MFEVLKSRYAVWKRYSRTVAELESLSNRELADLGIAQERKTYLDAQAADLSIARSDIPRLAREAARS